jgi:hypothetical protein
MHLGRGPEEATDSELVAFYDRLLACLDQPAFREGEWQLLEPARAWEGNGSNDSLVTYAWTGPNDERRMVAVNYSPDAAQGYVRLPWSDLDGSAWQLRDSMSSARYVREGGQLVEQGLYLDLQPWQFHVFEVTP